MKVKVWDPLVRIFHWGLALAVLGSFLTSERDRFVPVHVALGLAILAMLVVRVAWGFLGPRPARFASFVRGPRQVLEYAREMLRGRPPRHLSHNPLGGAMAVTILAVLAGLVVTGGVVYAGPEFAGPLTGLIDKRAARGVKEIHEALSNGLLTLIGVHLAGVLASSLLERQNLVAGMITGRKQLDGAPPAPERDSGPGARFASTSSALALGAAAVVAVATLLGFPHRATASPSVAERGPTGRRGAAPTVCFTVLHHADGNMARSTGIVNGGLPGGIVTALSAALRRISSIALAVAFVAMATSGLFMLAVDRFGSQLRMHPVHNVFGIIMVVAGLLHGAFNWKILAAHLRRRLLMLLGVVLASVMVLLFIEGITRPVDVEVTRKIDDILSEARRAEHAD